jgi:ABC-2 type transport system permease protein
VNATRPNDVRASLGRILAIVRKEALQLLRDRLTFGMVVGIPLMQTVLFGYAINQDIRHLRAAVADQSGSQRARWLVADAQASQVVDVVAHVPTAESLEDLLRRGEVSVGIFLPEDFERRASQDGRSAGQLLIDGSDPIVLQAARALAELPLREAERRAPQGAGPAAPAFEIRPFYNPERRSAVQIVPGIIGVILTMTMTLFTAVAIVRERERGNLELLITTPVRTPELMLGKIVPYIAIGMFQVTLVLVVGSLLFRVPMRGSLAALYISSLVFVVATLGLGLLISTAVQTQFQAFQLSFVSFLPQLLLSGFMFPFDGMPRPAQAIAEIFPLTHFVRIIRGILLRGATLGEVSRDLWPLLAFFLVTMALSVLRFRKRLD